MANSLFKAYAKQAKKRLKEGFWSDVKNQRNYFELVAATNGGSADFAVNRQKQALKNQLYNREHSAEEEFYRRVCGILSGDEVVTNPIARLMDSEAAAQMSPQQKNTYICCNCPPSINGLWSVTKTKRGRDFLYTKTNSTAIK